MPRSPCFWESAADRFETEQGLGVFIKSGSWRFSDVWRNSSDARILQSGLGKLFFS